MKKCSRCSEVFIDEDYIETEKEGNLCYACDTKRLMEEQ